MSDPQRLLADDSVDPTGRMLLESWQQEGPPVDGRTRTLAALGIASGAAAIGATTTLGSIAPKAAASLSLIKWLGLAVLLGLAAVGGATYLMMSRSKVSTPVAANLHAPLATDSIPVAPLAASPSVTFESAEPSPAQTTSGPRRIARVNESVRTSDRLSDQIALIDAARRALSTGEIDQAETLAANYETKFPHGAFSEEAEAIRITALNKNGDAAKARVLGAAFLQAHPSSPYATRIRALVDGANP